MTIKPRPGRVLQPSPTRPQARAPRPPRVDRRGFTIGEVREGLTMQAMEDVAQRLRVERTALARVLGTSVRTLQRRAEGEERLAPSASDRLARVARILELAIHVLGEGDKASHWLTSKSRALGEVPLELLDTDLGTQRVEQALRQIEFGMAF